MPTAGFKDSKIHISKNIKNIHHMSLQLKKDFTWSLLVPTSMGVRITPANGQPVHSSDLFQMYASSAETNVASISSYLGLSVKVLTTFVKDSPISMFIKNCLLYTSDAADDLLCV